MPFLHDHRRRVPTQDHDRSVAVGVVPVPTRGTAELRLVLSRSAVHGPAGRAGLGRKGRVHLHETMRLVEQHRLDLVPADVQDGAVQSALLCNVPARLRDGAGGRGRHVLRAQPLDHDCSVATGNLRRGLVRPVLADAGLLGPQGGNPALCLGVTNGATLPPGSDALRLADAPVQVGHAGGQAVAGAVREHQGDGHAPVDADSAARVGNISVDQATDGHLPAQGGAADRRLSDRSYQRARQAQLHPADLGQADTPPAAVDLLEGNLAPSVAESVVDALLLRLRIAALGFPRAAIGFIQRLQRALQGRDVNRAHKIDLGPKRGQFAGLRHVVQIVARADLVVPPMVAPLFQRDVPHKATDPGEPGEGIRLLCCRIEPVGETAIHGSLI